MEAEVSRPQAHQILARPQTPGAGAHRQDQQTPLAMDRLLNKERQAPPLPNTPVMEIIVLFLKQYITNMVYLVSVLIIIILMGQLGLRTFMFIPIPLGMDKFLEMAKTFMNTE